jgi:enamine deaminase RidA (YjgF/YER057c/UK114 family)
MIMTRQSGAAAAAAPGQHMTSGLRVLQPSGWPQPKGYANGFMAEGRLVVTGGVVGWDVAGRFAEGFVAQVRQALENIVAILADGGAGPEHLVRLTWYVVDMDEYLANLKALGKVYRDVIGTPLPEHGAGAGRTSGRAVCTGRDRGNGGHAAVTRATSRSRRRPSPRTHRC